MRELKARDVMPTQVVTVSSKALVIAAAKLMLANRISDRPVLDDFDRLVGVVSEADLWRPAEIGTQAVDCETMRLKRVPGIEDGKVVGVVSRADLRRALVNEIATSATRTAHRARLERSPGLKALAVY